MHDFQYLAIRQHLEPNRVPKVFLDFRGQRVYNIRLWLVIDIRRYLNEANEPIVGISSVELYINS